MNVFGMRDCVLDLQSKMLEGARSSDNEFLSLVSFENWCSNSGLSGYAQDFSMEDIDFIESFSIENNIDVVKKMIATLRQYANSHGDGFIDLLTEEEIVQLSQYDNDFFEILEQYTELVYRKFVAE